MDAIDSVIKIELKKNFNHLMKGEQACLNTYPKASGEQKLQARFRKERYDYGGWPYSFGGGSRFWETALGIEFIRRNSNPALILVLTVTIRQQWVDRIREAFFG